MLYLRWHHHFRLIEPALYRKFAALQASVWLEGAASARVEARAKPAFSYTNELLPPLGKTAVYAAFLGGCGPQSKRAAAGLVASSVRWPAIRASERFAVLRRRARLHVAFISAGSMASELQGIRDAHAVVSCYSLWFAVNLRGCACPTGRRSSGPSCMLRHVRSVAVGISRIGAGRYPTSIITHGCDHFHAVHEMSPLEVAQRINADQVRNRCCAPQKRRHTGARSARAACAVRRDIFTAS